MRQFFLLLLFLFGLSYSSLASTGAEERAIDIVNPCSDFGFKKAFKEPMVAISFLNTILNLEGEEAINEVRYIDPELSSRSPEGRDFTVDVLCRSRKGELFLLEMQHDYREDYTDKVLVEFCRLMGNVDAARYESCPSGKTHEEDEGGRDDDEDGGGAAAPPQRKRLRLSKDFWTKIPKVVTLVITNKRFRDDQMKRRFPDQRVMEPEVINTYTLRHTTHPGRRLGNIDARIVLVMLANFRKDLRQLEDTMDRWLFALKDERLSTGHEAIDAYKHVDSLADAQGDDPGIQRFYDVLDKTHVGGVELQRYAEGVEAVRARMERHYEEGKAAGVEEGKAAGIEEGRKQTLLQIARAMRRNHATNADIARALEITEAEVAAMGIGEEAS